MELLLQFAIELATEWTGVAPEWSALIALPLLSAVLAAAAMGGLMISSGL